MATKMKIYEIAKSLNKPSKDLIKALNENGFEVKSHNSNIEDEAIAFVLKNFKPDAGVASTAKKEQKVEGEAVKKEEIKQEVGEEKRIEKTEEMKKEKQVIGKTEEKLVEKIVETSEEKKTEQSVERVQQNQTEKTYSTNNRNTQNQDNRNTQGQNNRNNQMNRNSQNQMNRNGQSQMNRNAQGQNNQMNRGGQGQNNQMNRNAQGQNQNNQMNRNGQNQYSHNNSNQVNRNNQGQNSQGQNNRNYNQQRNNNDYANRQGGGNYSQGQNNRSNQGQNNQGQNNRNTQGQNNRGSQNTYSNQGQNNRNNQSPNNRNNQGQNNRNNNDRNGFNKSNFDKGGFGSSFGEKSGMEKSGGRNNAQRNGNGFNKNKNKRNNENNNTPKKDPNRKGAFIMPKPVIIEPELEDTIKTILIPEVITIKELADRMKTPAAAVVKKLFLQGKMVSINHEITFEEAEEIALEYNCIVEIEEQIDVIEELLKEEDEDEAALTKRPPVVCVMGHVDHGKTSLLDAIRKTHVTEREAGGITQHIGAYMVSVNGEKITFLDTPGHEAFTSMRMRGAKSTDIAILVVAADDGVMPQTIEAISHAKAAGVEIIVAVNKMDKESANIERVKQELVEHELIAEDWGGDTVFVPVSAHSGEGIEQLLEMIALTAEVCELKANANRKARGIVIEAQLDKGRGPVATILVQKGTLHVGDSIAVGRAYGKIRAMMDDKGRRVKIATPSTPVEILGLNEVPEAGEIFLITDNDKEARSIAETYIKQGREKLLADTKAKLSLDGLFSQIQAGNIKELNIIVKADVQGSVEAVKQSLLKLSNEEVAIRIIHGGVGAINESDVSLASASNAIIIGFNVRPDQTAKDIADREKVDLRQYKVIYNAIEDVEAAMKGLLDPVYEEKVIGHAEVRQIFKASGLGVIAGSYVLDGKIIRNSKARITREGELVFEGELASLKRFKDDVKEVAAGYECGLVFEKFNDLKEEDKVEIYIMEEVPR